MKATFISILFLGFVLVGSSFAQCPTITVQGPAGITNPGDNMTFETTVGVVGPKLAYSWTVSAGTIVEGQGTPRIKIATDRSLEGANVTATVEIAGLDSNCERFASETAPMMPKVGCGAPADEWGTLKPNDIRGRLDVAFAELSNNPTSVGVFWISIVDQERLDVGNPRVQLILKHVKYRKFDASRIVIALELGVDQRTKFYRMPPGADMPCTECVIVKGAYY